ncbi:unnamed protein product [Prorocentrum cordatum]|uniref:Uncharacterized protein n=1 Tax=Prorocentrum cordatum TaxID=2364126 RepID=A0ABN9WJG3_9DINO|nr:unnamed protein product [Polarella glacialis]
MPLVREARDPGLLPGETGRRRQGLQIDPALTGAWADITGGAALEPAAAAPSGSPSAASRDERQSASSSSSSRPQPEVPAQQWPSAVDLWEERADRHGAGAVHMQTECGNFDVCQRAPQTVCRCTLKAQAVRCSRSSVKRRVQYYV